MCMPDFSKFMVECNASDFGLGAVLMQEGRPIAFMSKDFRKLKSLSTYEFEVLSILLVVRGGANIS